MGKEYVTTANVDRGRVGLEREGAIEKHILLTDDFETGMLQPLDTEFNHSCHLEQSSAKSL